jgi:carboxylate-amine ligase
MEVNTRVLIYELLDFVDDVVDHLGSRPAIQYIQRIMEIGTGADRQLEVFQQSQSMTQVVESIRASFLDGIS